MSQSDFASSKLFFDNKHFPRGFSRSGLFSKKEAEILERHGFAMQELANGNRAPVGAAEKAFVQMIAGERTAETEFEKAWSKYKYHTTNRRVSYTTGMAFSMSDSGDYSDADVD
ncbi:MAG: DUF413 domain-containing protein [Hahellaceae bacterium]|nr:DUF413 domain-containing protein [Hahellaceae bacterium]